MQPDTVRDRAVSLDDAAGSPPRVTAALIAVFSSNANHYTWHRGIHKTPNGGSLTSCPRAGIADSGCHVAEAKDLLGTTGIPGAGSHFRQTTLPCRCRFPQLSSAKTTRRDGVQELVPCKIRRLTRGTLRSADRRPPARAADSRLPRARRIAVHRNQVAHTEALRIGGEGAQMLDRRLPKSLNHNAICCANIRRISALDARYCAKVGLFGQTLRPIRWFGTTTSVGELRRAI